MSASFQILAQVNMDPDFVDVTFGGVIAGLLVMAMLAGSLVVIVLWGIRLSQGLEIIPAAIRKPLFVPLPLMIFGVALTAMMAMLMLESTFLSPQNGAADAVADSAEPIDVPDGQLSEPDAAISDETPVDETGVAEEETTDSDDTAKETAASSTATETQALLMVYQQLMFFAMIFIVFGVTVWLTQLNRSRGTTDSGNVTYPISVASTRTFYAEPRFPDLDEPSEITPRPEVINPFAAPDPLSEELPEDSTAEPEKWQPAVELRFAFETFLAAYLPTAVLRIIIVLLLPESPSHPFLEMMDDGVSWTLLLLIGLMAVVIAPIVEELLYRVTILGGIMQQRSLAAGWILSSVLFAFAHGFPDSIALLPLAFAIGYTYIKRRSYRTVVLVHFLFNTFNMAVAGLSLL